jgi:hypothetical protein
LPTTDSISTSITLVVFDRLLQGRNPRFDIFRSR